MEKPDLGTIEQQINKAGIRVMQMRREGRDHEYMVNQLDFEGFDHQVIQRLMYAAKEEHVKEVTQIKKAQGSTLLLKGIITFVVGCSLSFIPTLFDIGEVYYVFGVGAVFSGIVMIVMGWRRK